ncbi:MAG: SPOR domain-containing protein [Bacteroidota bacterium]
MIKLIFSILIFTEIVFSQLSSVDFEKQIDRIYTGKIDLVLKELPELKKTFPYDIQVEYLDALLTKDGEIASKKFLTIANKNPLFDYSDDALYRVYQYHYTRGEYINADQIFARLQNDYPNSDYRKIENLESRQSINKKNNSITVQVGAFSEKLNAEKLIQQLSSYKIISEVRTKESARQLFFVVVDGFKSIEEAQNFISKLKQDYGISSIIFKNAE